MEENAPSGYISQLKPRHLLVEDMTQFPGTVLWMKVPAQHIRVATRQLHTTWILGRRKFPDRPKLEQLPQGSLEGSLPHGNPAVPKPPMPGLAAGLDGGSSLHASPFCISQVGVGVKPLLHPSRYSRCLNINIWGTLFLKGWRREEGK